MQCSQLQLGPRLPEISLVVHRSRKQPHTTTVSLVLGPTFVGVVLTGKKSQKQGTPRFLLLYTTYAISARNSQLTPGGGDGRRRRDRHQEHERRRRREGTGHRGGDGYGERGLLKSRKKGGCAALQVLTFKNRQAESQTKII